jgi:FkbH-like protein
MKLTITGSSYLFPNNNAWRELGSKYDLNFSDYGSWANELINSDPESIMLIVLFLEDLYNQDINKVEEIKKNLLGVLNLIEQRLKKSNKPTIISASYLEVHNLVQSSKKNPITKKVYFWFLSSLEELGLVYKSLYFIDLDNEFSKIGKNLCLDKRNWYLASSHISNKGLAILAKTAFRLLNRCFLAPHKVLVLDCDNTIWGGVIGEDGIHNILLGEDGLGKVYQDFQRAVKKINNQGVLILLASKNNESDVWEVFNNHQLMVLEKKDITAYRINWKEKYKNIIEMSKELDLGLDSFVFWDDSPVERDKMKINLPEVFTIDTPAEVFKWPEYLINLDCFSIVNSTKEDLFKKEQYANRAVFLKDKSNIMDEKSYLKTINILPKTHELNESNINRAAQLCGKTNQFNLRTIRYSFEDLNNISKIKSNIIFLTSLKDKYGDHGLVGLNYLKKIDKDYIFIDIFLMSCRAMGRYLEAWMLLQIIDISKKLGFKYIISEYIKTKKNVIVESFYINYGFTKLEKKNVSKKLALFSNDKSLFIRSTESTKVPYGEIYEKN